MDLWTFWLDAIRGLLAFLSSDIGLGAGLGIIVMTVLVRTAILPLTWGAAYRGYVRQKKLQRLRPELEKLKQRFSGESQLYLQHLTSLYRNHGLKLVDGASILGALAQMPILLGIFQVLRAGPSTGRFLWISNLARPDLWLALVAGLATTLLVAANPELPENLRLVMIMIPAILAFMAALKFSSALALYWTTTNFYSALQTATLHFVVSRRIRSGALTI
jgi:YidC/Oxa1 family membrane protein insertase